MRNRGIVGLSLLGILLIGAVLAQKSAARVQVANPKGDESKEVMTQLGFLGGKMEVVGMPQGLNISASVLAAGDHGQSASVSAAPNQNYAMPLAPGTYQVHAEFGSAKSRTVPVTIRNGKTEQLDFAFGREEKQ